MPGAAAAEAPVPYRAVVLPPTPRPSSEATRTHLRRTGRRDTAPELALRRELHRRGLRFLVDVSPQGTSRRRRADIVLPGARIAVLVHGCFWHSCPVHCHAPQANAGWWQQKFHSIAVRDLDTERQLLHAGWLPVVVWEHEDMEAAADELLDLHRRRAGAGRLGRRQRPDGSAR